MGAGAALLTWLVVAFLSVVRVHVKAAKEAKPLTDNEAIDGGMLALAWPVIVAGAIIGHGAGWLVRVVRRAG